MTPLSKTELLLMAAHRSPTVRLEDICQKYLNIGMSQARVLASRNMLGIPTFRLNASQKSPIMVSLAQLAEYIDKQAETATEDWTQSQV